MNSLRVMTAEFVGRVSGAVWIGKLSEEAAQEALSAYVAACQRSGLGSAADVHRIVISEYRYRREGQELCS